MEAVPTQAEVYERLSSQLDPILAGLGMQRVLRLSYPCWVLKRLTDAEQLYFAVQVDEKATDSFAGGGFRFELEKSTSARPAGGLNGRALFFQLLTVRELTDILAQQNKVISLLPKPPPAQVEVYPAGRVRQEYISWFEAQDGFDTIRSWMRYRSLDDIDEWVRTLEPLLGSMVDRAAEYLRRGTRHLGRGSLIEGRS